MAGRRGSSGAEATTLVDFAKLLEKAFCDGGAASRAANDALNRSLDETGKALVAANKRCNELEANNAKLLDLLTKLGVAHTQHALIEAHERIEVQRIAAEKDWRSDLLKQLGPGAKTLVDFVAARFTPKLLTGDGTPEGNGRAALMRVVMKIMGDTALQDRIVSVVGVDDWVATIEFLQRQAGASAAPTTPANGVASN